MTQEADNNSLPLKTQNAATRLSGVITIDSILRYAVTLHEPQELKVIKQMISDLGLRNRCRKADVAECIRFIDSLIEECYRPRIVEQHNDRCQQFYGNIYNNDINKNKKHRKK